MENLEKIVEKYFNKEAKKTCEQNYLKNQFLRYALSEHNSVQCIGRTYAEALCTSASLLPPQHRTNLLYHSNQILTYLQNYNDTSILDDLSVLLNKFLEKISMKYDYLILFCFIRTKSFRSVEAKIRYRLAMQSTLDYLLSNFDKIEEFSKLAKNEKAQTKNELKKFSEINKKKNPTKDMFGVRFIIDKVKKDSSETDLVNFCYSLKKELIDFLTTEGLELIEEKDYISKPKPETNYKSLHLTFSVLRFPIEIQIRTSNMHFVAEHGSASHEKVYKDTIIQNFTREFMYDLSQGKRLVSNENNCLLKSYNFFERHISKTPNGEVPKSALALNKINDKDFMQVLKEQIENNAIL